MKNHKKTTEFLLNEIKNMKNPSDITKYEEQNHQEMLEETFSAYLNSLMNKKNISRVSDIVKKSNLKKSYVHQIINGKKHPSRDFVIALAFGFELNIDETQALLKQAGYKELYPRVPRDAALLFSIEHTKKIIDVNEILDEQGFDLLPITEK